MDFNYGNRLGDCMAELFHMDGEPEQVCLNLYDQSVSSKVTTLYYDGEIVKQDAFDTSDVSIKKFYKGDKLTITF